MSTDTPVVHFDVANMLDRFDGLNARAEEIDDQAQRAAIKLVGDFPPTDAMTAVSGAGDAVAPPLLAALSEKLDTLHTRLETISNSIRPINEVTGT